MVGWTSNFLDNSAKVSFIFEGLQATLALKLGLYCFLFVFI